MAGVGSVWPRSDSLTVRPPVAAAAAVAVAAAELVTRTAGPAAGEFRPASPSWVQGYRKEDVMPKITKIGRVMVPVAGQDEAIRFYTQTLGFSLAADVPCGDGTVPLLFFFRDNNKNQLMIVQAS